jgi:Ca2+-binding RTX toxin-like protein
LYGGGNSDTLYGEAGDDSLYGEAGDDLLDGGADYDKGKDDPGTPMTSIELVL